MEHAHKRPDSAPAFAEEGDEWHEKREREEKAAVHTPPDQRSLLGDASSEERWRRAEEGALEAIRKLSAKERPERRLEHAKRKIHSEKEKHAGSQNNDRNPDNPVTQTDSLNRSSRISFGRVLGKQAGKFGSKTLKAAGTGLRIAGRETKAAARVAGREIGAAARRAGKEAGAAARKARRETLEWSGKQLKAAGGGIAKEGDRRLGPLIDRTWQKALYYDRVLKASREIQDLSNRELIDRARLPALEADIQKYEAEDRQELENFTRNNAEAQARGDTAEANRLSALHGRLSRELARELARLRTEKSGIETRRAEQGPRLAEARARKEAIDRTFKERMERRIRGIKERYEYRAKRETLEKARREVEKETEIIGDVTNRLNALRPQLTALLADKRWWSPLSKSFRHRRDDLKKRIAAFEKDLKEENIRKASNEQTIEDTDADMREIERRTDKFWNVLVRLNLADSADIPARLYGRGADSWFRSVAGASAAPEPSEPSPEVTPATLPADTYARDAGSWFEPAPTVATGGGEEGLRTETDAERQRKAWIERLTNDRNEFRNIAREKGGFDRRDLAWIRKEREWLRTISPETIDASRAVAINNFRTSVIAAMDAVLSDKNLQSKEEKGPRSTQLADLLDLMLQAYRRDNV